MLGPDDEVSANDVPTNIIENLSDEAIKRRLDALLLNSTFDDAAREKAPLLPPGPTPAHWPPEAPEWAYQFPVGGRFPLNGWFCEILGHYMDDDDHPLGFVIRPLHKTGNALKRVEKQAEARKLALVKRLPRAPSAALACRKEEVPDAE